MSIAMGGASQIAAANAANNSGAGGQASAAHTEAQAFFSRFVEAQGSAMHGVYLHNISNGSYRHDLLKKRDLMEFPGA